ncbi:vacuolar protein sorting-associated protein 51 homolog isoform X2 [Bactrocera neohumeralis]|uniref:vacuolar protein sorting-associated protein 51 homolog isoform X2 n=1 Tax=Bactrocera tryoni TaxID=59916 RepID=UPI001A9718AC|nr:vacuolar protein sorting-associated protein 51 homolog isoform X2 [Bactrocera tryoni]XP_050325611.1 vacuolar protein sorting-associated protein 51 homolog isoform X2 [Bactrocera neohumeralis]
MTEHISNPYDMDSSAFDSEKYLEKLLKDCTLKQIMDTETAVIKDTQTLHSDMQTLVYENYNKFISATDTIRKMKNDFKEMESDMNLLRNKMNSITSFSEQITDTLQGTRSQLCRLSEKHSLLKRLQFLSSLPAKLKGLIEEQNYAQAVQDYLHAQKVFAQYGRQPSFDGIQRDCASILLDLKGRLRNDFQMASNSAQSLSEIGELLLQLDEKPADLANEMLTCAGKRLHEQIVLLQDQTERDMIEFVDMGIEGFLNDLTLVVTSYFDMFVTKSYDKESDDFQEHSLRQLNVFLNQNIDKYMTLVHDRVESDIGFGDTQILLRALDRLHRRLLAMRNICRGLEIQRNTVDIIIAAAHQLCEAHSKSLKDHFSDSLSSVRLALVSAKSDNNNGANLNELITNLYMSMVEKVKGVLQDLLVFLQTDWSFNIKADYKGGLCVEGIRESLLIGFLRHISKMMCSFAEISSPSPPNLLLVLSKTCVEMEQNGVHILITLVDDLYEIDSENSAVLTHETEICAEMRETAQTLLDAYVRLQGTNISQMMRKSVETRDWLNCLEPRSVRAVMKRVVEELASIETVVASLYEAGVRTTASSDSSRKTHFSTLTTTKQHYRSNWSNYTPSQLESNYVSNIHRLFSERIDIFTNVDFSKVSIVTGIIKIGLKTLLECVRLRTFSKFGLQQVQVDTHYLQMNLWRFVADENLVNFLLDEILGSAVHRCLESILMEPNAVEIICERA